MKKIITFLLVVIIVENAKAQTPAEQVANHIAQKMKDTLELTITQQQQIREINLQLSSKKQAARAASTDPRQVSRQFQVIENTRDSLYQPVLGTEKYQLYQQKKNSLISGQ